MRPARGSVSRRTRTGGFATRGYGHPIGDLLSATTDRRRPAAGKTQQARCGIFYVEHGARTASVGETVDGPDDSSREATSEDRSTLASPTGAKIA